MKKKNLYLFNSNLNTNYKATQFNSRLNEVGETRYLPPVSKEWKNTVYSYYKNNMKNLPNSNITANKLIKNYFDVYFKNHKFINSKLLSVRRRREFLKRIYVSNIETKHTNSKVIMTMYTSNIGKSKLKKNYIINLKRLRVKILKVWRKKLLRKIKSVKLIQNINKERNNILLSKYKNMKDKKNLFAVKYKFMKESLQWYNLYLKLYLTRIVKLLYNNQFQFLRKFQYLYYLNKYKFEQEMFLSRLKMILSKLYNNNVEFNIVNLKSVTFNADIFTQALALKLRKRTAGAGWGITRLITRTKLPQGSFKKNIYSKNKVNYKLLQNKYDNLNLLSIMKLKNNDSLTRLIKRITSYTSQNLLSKSKVLSSQDYKQISDLIFNSIKYKNVGGVRIEVRGRLTKRYRADRSLFKLKWKGGLKDAYSSYKKLSTVTYRGYLKPNLSYASTVAKRHVGAFAVKGWVGGR